MYFASPQLLAASQIRLLNFDFPVLFQGTLNIPSQLLIVVAIIALSFGLSIWFANANRLKDYGWKIGLVLCSFCLALFVVLFGEYRLNVDLKGGTILICTVDERETAALNPNGRSDEWSMGELIGVLNRRLNPDGLKEIVIRPVQRKKVEIIVPETDGFAVEKIKEQIRTGGALQFMVVAGEAQDQDRFEAAQAQAARSDDRLRRDVVNDKGVRVAYWAELGREERQGPDGPDPKFRELDSVRQGFIRNASTGEIIELTLDERNRFAGSDADFKQFLAQRGIKEVDVLLNYDPEYDVRGSDLGFVGKDRDERLRPSINFRMKNEGIYKMGTLTQENIERKLAIVFDNTLLSAPVIRSKITDNGQITGEFTEAEVDFIVGILRSGSMPVVLEDKIPDQRIGAILGRDTREKGSRSVVIALIAVLVFMAVYYRFAGLVACFALTLNLGLTVAIMIVLKAPFSLPGLAGLVLTVAMSVDANVLISERIREELAKGATLRMAIRNGFDKALSAIIDGNLTTLLTAIVLYVIGAEQIKGFGITLMLGNITSMFTAVFCARVIFDVFERMRWIKTLSMMNILSAPKIDWVPFIGPAAVGSLILIVVGVVATVARGRGLFDIDLGGGTSVTFMLQNPMPEDEVRRRLEAELATMVDPSKKNRVDHNVYELAMEGQPGETVFKVDSSLDDIALLKEAVRKALRLENGAEGLVTFQMEVGNLRPVAEQPPSTGAPPAADLSKPPEKAPPTTEEQPAQKPAEKPADAPADPAAEKPADADKQPAENPADPPAKPEDKPAEPAPANEKPAEAPQPDSAPQPKSGDEPAADELEACDEEAAEAEATPAADQAVEAKPATEAAADSPTAAKPAEEKPAEEKSAPDKPAEASQTAEPAAAAAPAATPETPPASAETTPKPGESPPATAEAPPTAPPVTRPAAREKTEASLSFPGSPIGGEALRQRVMAGARAAINQQIDVEVKNDEWDGKDQSTYEAWTVILPVGKKQAGKILEEVRREIQDDVVWQTESEIDPAFSVEARWQAVMALFISLLGIVAYVWFRFQKAAWGLAAVAALAHDALVMLTGIALSYWCVGFLGFLGVEEFKISLPVVAAFLTLLGYSVNDTIVIFDRLREIRGKSPYITRQMINDAVNQTLSRTVILAGITLSTVIILFAFGGSGIHAFAFALVIGVVSGCYSTLVIAAPLLLWLLGKPAEAGKVAPRQDRGPESTVVPKSA